LSLILCTYSGKTKVIVHGAGSGHYSQYREPADRVTVPSGRLSVPANDNDDETDSVKTLWKLFD